MKRGRDGLRSDEADQELKQPALKRVHTEEVPPSSFYSPSPRIPSELTLSSQKTTEPWWVHFFHVDHTKLAYNVDISGIKSVLEPLTAKAPGMHSPGTIQTKLDCYVFVDSPAKQVRNSVPTDRIESPSQHTRIGSPFTTSEGVVAVAAPGSEHTQHGTDHTLHKTSTSPLPRPASASITNPPSHSTKTNSHPAWASRSADSLSSLSPVTPSHRSSLATRGTSSKHEPAGPLKRPPVQSSSPTATAMPVRPSAKAMPAAPDRSPAPDKPAAQYKRPGIAKVREPPQPRRMPPLLLDTPPKPPQHYVQRKDKYAHLTAEQKAAQQRNLKMLKQLRKK